MKTDVPSLTFSLKTLLFTVTLAALFLGLYLAIGLASLAIASLTLLGFAGFASYMDNTPIPYWKCIGSGAILFYLIPPLGYQPGHAETILNSILFATGAFLVYSSIRYGHWSTRLLGIVVLIPYVLGFCLIVQNAFRNWHNIIDYWTT